MAEFELTSTHLFIAFSIVYIALFIVVIVQLYKTKRAYTQHYPKFNSCSASSSAGSQMRLYSVHVDSHESDLLNMELVGQLTTDLRTFLVPLYCATQKKTTMVNAEMTSYGFLSLKKNGQSDALMMDVQMGRLRYLVINNKMFLVRSLPNTLEQSVRDHIIGHILTLVAFKPTHSSDNCHVNLKPFIGNLYSSDSWNLSSILGTGLDLDTHPVHMMAYTL